MVSSDGVEESRLETHQLFIRRLSARNIDGTLCDLTNASIGYSGISHCNQQQR